MDEMKVEVTRRLRYHPAHFEVEEHRRHVYLCNPCSAANAAGEEVAVHMKRAPGTPALFCGSIATPSLIAGIIYGKYVMSAPIYRIEADFARQGVVLPRSVMCSWVVKAADRWFSLIFNRMKEKLLSRDVLHADETEIQVLKEPERKASTKSYMWSFTTADGDTPITLFEYHPSRSADIPKAFLKGWSGFLHADGYKAYYSLGDNIIVIACLAHIRRKFADIVKGAGKSIPSDSVALQAMNKLDNIFHVEHGYASMKPERRCQARRGELMVLVESFYAWLRERHAEALPGYALYKAIEYAVNQRPYVMNIFLDGRLAISNNRAERAIRPFAVGRRYVLPTFMCA
jgi:transposase